MKKVNYIPIVINKDSSIYEEFHSSSLSSSLDSYLLREVSFYSVRDEIVLQVTCVDCNIDMNQFSNVLHNYYDKCVKYYTKMDHIDDLKRLGLLFLGVVCIMLSNINSSLFSEILYIASWVTIWEFLYDILFGEVERKYHLKQYKILANCKIEYVTNSNVDNMDNSNMVGNKD